MQIPIGQKKPVGIIIVMEIQIMYYYDVCEPGYWWVTTAIEVLVVLMLIGVSLLVIKHLLGIRKNRLGITLQARQK